MNRLLVAAALPLLLLAPLLPGAAAADPPACREGLMKPVYHTFYGGFVDVWRESNLLGGLQPDDCLHNGQLVHADEYVGRIHYPNCIPGVGCLF